MIQPITLQSAGLQRALNWFARENRRAFPFQLEAWAAYLNGKSGLIQAPTGMGKTLAAAPGPMIQSINAPELNQAKQIRGAPPLTLLWITPLRALAGDTAGSLQRAVAGLEIPWTVELRTADTSATVRKRQRERLPTILITTPESLSLLLSYPDTGPRLGSLQCVVVDEWHELMGTKRGVQTELGLARLRGLQPGLRIWGLSATLGNTEEALQTLLGNQNSASQSAVRINAPDSKVITVASLLPEKIERFPWSGHLGKRMVNDVVRRINSAASSLVFTNTRAQSELWFRALLEAAPQLLGQLAVHHGSLDRKLRQSVEQLLRDGKLRAVVCTSSLDLGVDFWPVDQVIQIGSPKSIARAMQRAGRSGHQPGSKSQIVCVPTQAFELVEFSATRMAIERRAVERREPVLLPLDLLAQHVVTIAAGDGFVAPELFAEIRSTHAFAALTDAQWQWVMDFAQRGGPSLVAYPQFARVREEAGRWICASPQLAKMHRLSIGTIVADGAVSVRFVKGKYLGTVEESFIARLRPGDTFAFAGRIVEFVRVHEMTAQVRVSKSKKAATPRWMGGRFPLSSNLADAVRVRLHQAADGIFPDDEMRHIRPILQLQQRWSVIPRCEEILIEHLCTREGFHYFLFPFQGRLAHEGLAALLMYRLAQRGLKPITATFNDYGLELLSPHRLAANEQQWRSAMSPEYLADDIWACVNSGELARRHFREIVRIAGLLLPTRPGAPRSVRQLQASSQLFYDVFAEFDPQNLLLDQARREVLERQLEFSRLQNGLRRMAGERLTLSNPTRMSPLAFPLWAERIGSQQLRVESAAQRIERLALQLEQAANLEESAPQNSDRSKMAGVAHA